jgi:metallo-beta-lactamase family protein
MAADAARFGWLWLVAVVDDSEGVFLLDPALASKGRDGAHGQASPARARRAADGRRALVQVGVEERAMDLTATTADHPVPEGRVTLLGAVRCVTGAMTRVETGGAVLLVDCGAPQGREAAGWQLPDAACDACAVLLTHAHFDHVGALPALLERGHSGPWIGTPATLEIAEIVLTDSLRLQDVPDAEVQRFRQRFRQLARPAPYDTPTRIAGFDGTVVFREAGHILGSASIDIGSRAARVLVSGDLGRPDSPILRDYCTSWPAHRPFDLVVLESTYGQADHGQPHDEVPGELERILGAAHERGGHVVVPAFAIGRTQTLLYHLNTLVEAGRIPRMPVAVDTPMGLRVTESYQRFRRLFDREALDKIAHGDDPLDFDDLYAVTRHADSARLDEVREAMIVIAGSGMCTGGRIVSHLERLLPLPETTVLFVGYQSTGTLGAEIQKAARAGAEADRRVVIRGDCVPVRATVETLSGLSAHADRAELRRWLEAVPAVRRVALHHGEASAQHALARYLSRSAV